MSRKVVGYTPGSADAAPFRDQVQARTHDGHAQSDP